MALGCLAVLTVLAGCQQATREAAPEATYVAPAAQASGPAAPENAIDVALAREGTEPPPPAPAAPVLNPNAPKSYTVQRGDTLWDISALFLRDPWLWPEIWHVNNQIANPHLIYPGDVLTLAYGADGSPGIYLTRGDAVRVSPLVRTSPLEGPISTIPYEAIAAFLGKPSIVSKEDLRLAPRVAALRDHHLVGSLGHEIYVKGLEDHGPGRYAVVRVGEELKDPETGKVLGYLGTYTASARVDAVGEVSKALLVESGRETLAGDLLFAEDLQTARGDLAPRAPPAGISGQIIAVADGGSLIGQYQVVAVNRGASHGLAPGHVLAIDQKGELVEDRSSGRLSLGSSLGKKIRLPDERAGTLLVFKTYDALSYGLVVSATVPIHVADVVRTP